MVSLYLLILWLSAWLTIPWWYIGLVGVLDDLEHFAKSTGDAAAMSSVKEARASMERLIGKMDGIESGFDRIAERSCEPGSPVMSFGY